MVYLAIKFQLLLLQSSYFFVTVLQKVIQFVKLSCQQIYFALVVSHLVFDGAVFT